MCSSDLANPGVEHTGFRKQPHAMLGGKIGNLEQRMNHTNGSRMLTSLVQLGFLMKNLHFRTNGREQGMRGRVLRSHAQASEKCGGNVMTGNRRNQTRFTKANTSMPGRKGGEVIRETGH